MKSTVLDIMEQLKYVVIIYGIVALIHIFSQGTEVKGLLLSTAVSFAMVFIA